MKFLDSSIFLHAYLRPRRRLRENELRVKKLSKEIIENVDNGEEVLTTVVHISEIVNIVESKIGLMESISLLARLLTLKNILIVDVTRQDYQKALVIANKYKVSVNDALAYIKMMETGINEIYTFDKHFKSLPNIKVYP